jgi:hypothetical protein
MLFLTKIDGYQKNKKSDTNKNVTKMGVKAPLILGKKLRNVISHQVGITTI